MNPSKWLGKGEYRGRNYVSKTQLDEYLTLRSIEGISDKWLNRIRIILTYYLNYLDWSIDRNKTLKYILDSKNNVGVSSYRKRVYQIKKYLTYLKIDWADNIKLPPEPHYTPKLISKEDIQNTLEYFRKNQYYIQVKALMKLGITSGLRAEEIYQLETKDINLDKRIVRINHNPRQGQTTKTKQSRISFFNTEAKIIINEYLQYYNQDTSLKKLFSQSHISRLFKEAPIQVKDLRKYFSQEWDRRGGPTSIKKILMGHSLRGDVDLQHYNFQSEEDLKKIYDSVMLNSTLDYQKHR